MKNKDDPKITKRLSIIQKKQDGLEQISENFMDLLPD